jgi:hypothetical protein
LSCANSEVDKSSASSCKLNIKSIIIIVTN